MSNSKTKETIHIRPEAVPEYIPHHEASIPREVLEELALYRELCRIRKEHEPKPTRSYTSFAMLFASMFILVILGVLVYSNNQEIAKRCKPPCTGNTVCNPDTGTCEGKAINQSKMADMVTPDLLRNGNDD